MRYTFQGPLQGWWARQPIRQDHRQVAVTNQLWQFTLSMLISQYYPGHEHPAPFFIPHAIHTWAFPEIVILEQIEAFKLHIIDQGRFGQQSPKPTGLLCVHVPMAPHLLKDNELPPSQWGVGFGCYALRSGHRILWHRTIEGVPTTGKPSFSFDALVWTC